MKSFAVALLLLPAVLAGNAESIGVSSPLFVWSNRGVIGQGKHVSYQVLPHVEEVATELVLGAFGKGSEASNPRVHAFAGNSLGDEDSRIVVVFIGSQLDAADMRGRADAVLSLDAVLTDAVSSLVMPYATSEGASIRESVCTNLDQAGIQHEVVGCIAPSADLKADVSAALARGSQAVIVCSNVQEALRDTNAGLALEIEQLKAVQSAVGDAAINHVVVYASQAEDSSATAATVSADSGKRRSLLQTYSGFGEYTVCGPLCQTQVRWLEGMLAILVLALASCAGLVCLYVLDTPTRFETPKEAPPQQ